jgi:hypothetical protein
MKKLFWGCLLAANGMMLTSCLEGGSSEQKGTVLAVVDTHEASLRNILYWYDGQLPYYPGELASRIMPGESYVIEFTLRSEDNPDPYSVGYANIIVTGYERVEDGVVRHSLTDTATVLENELPALNIDIEHYVKGHLFLSTYHENMPDKQENAYELSYNREQTPVEENGRVVYDLFLRVTKTKDGSNPSSDRRLLRAYPNVDIFMNHISAIEKEKGKSQYYFRVNYIRSFGEDSSPVWAASEAIPMNIPRD